MKKAYQIAHAMVTKVGMSDSQYNMVFKTNDYNVKDYSDETNSIIDAEIKKIIERCHQESKRIIKEKKELIQQMSEALLEKETLALKDIEGILGKRPFQIQSKDIRDIIMEDETKTP